MGGGRLPGSRANIEGSGSPLSLGLGKKPTRRGR
uniref:Uncharacterized protein n=1 Tax=Arundo donax TaxID=35708 RepID=A0A0A9A5J4_ARUDO